MVTFLILCVVIFFLIKISNVKFIMHNSYILFLLLSFIVMIVIEAVYLIVEKKEIKPKKIFCILEYSAFIISGIFIISSLLLYNEEIINDNNAKKYIENALNMDDFEIPENEIVCTDGTAYKTIFTNKWCSYLTGIPFNKEYHISGIKVEYIDFHNDIIFRLLLNKYYKQMKNTYKFEEKNGIEFCEENLLNEKQIYVLNKSNNKIIFVKIYLKEETDIDVLMKKISNKINNISD